MLMPPGLHHITSLNHPELEPYRTMRMQEDHKKLGIFIAEGEKVVQRLLRSGIEVVSLLITPERLKNLAELAPENRYPVFLAEHKLIESIAGFRLHQGVMAIGRVPGERPLDETARRQEPPLFFVALDGIAHAENVGNIVRNCAAFGVQAVLAGETSCSPYVRRAVRNSMGGVFTTEVVHAKSLRESLELLTQKFSFSIIAAHPHTATTVDAIQADGNVCVVFGAEDSGISEDVKRLATQLIAIPMREGIDSLNVGSSSAVLLHEIVRKRSRPSA